MTLAVLRAVEPPDVGPPTIVVVRTGENGAEAQRQAREAAVSATAAAASEATAESLVGPTYASTAAGIAATTNGQFFAVNGSGTVTIYRNTSGTAVAQRTLATTTALAAPTGAAMVGYQIAEAGGEARNVEERLQEMRSIFDFIPYGKHAGLIDGTNLDDLTVYLQAAFDSQIPLWAPYGYINWEGNLQADYPLHLTGPGTRGLSAWYFRGTSGDALTLGNIGTSPNSQFHTIENIRFNNLGTCDSLLQIGSFQTVLRNIYIPTRLNGGAPCLVAPIDTNAAGTTLRLTLDRIYIDSAPANPNPVGIKLRRGGQMTVIDTHVQDCTVGIQVGTDGSVENFVMARNSRVQVVGDQSGTYPSLANAIGLDVQNVNSLSVRDSTFYTNNGETVGTSQRALKLGTVLGGEIAGNFLSGQGQGDSAIQVSSSARVVEIHGNTFSRFTSDAIVVDSGVYPWLEPRANTITTCPRLIDKRYRWGASGTFDPASQADGAGEATTLTNTNTEGLTPRIPTFTTALQGIMMSAYQSANGTTAVRFQNESGGTLDRASGTLAIRAVVEDDIKWDARASVDPASIVTNAQTTAVIAAPGAQLGDCVAAAFLNAQTGNLNGVALNAYVSVANQVTAIFYNGTTTSPRNLTVGTLRAVGLARFRLSVLSAYAGGTITSGSTAVLATITVTGGVIGDPLACSFDKDMQGVLMWAEMTGADTAKIYARNRTGADVTLVAGNLFAGVLQ